MKNKKSSIIYIVIFIILMIAIIFFLIIKKLNKQDYNISLLTTTTNECLKKDNICENGTKLNIKVNEITNYDFYVINDDGHNITLIMNKNLGNNTSWAENNTGCSNGPNSLINYIKELTNDWQNIKEKDYPIVDSNGCYDNKIEKMRARIPTLEDVNKLGCQYFNENTCPEFLISNLNSSSGYWLSTSNNPIDPNGAYVVNKEKNLFTPWVITSNNYGVRLIIEVEK